MVAHAFGEDPDIRIQLDLVTPPPGLPAVGQWVVGPEGGVGLMVLTAIREWFVTAPPGDPQTEAKWILHLIEAFLVGAGVDAETRRQVMGQILRIFAGPPGEATTPGRDGG